MVRTIVGSLRAAKASRASVVMRLATMSALGPDAVVGHRVPGGERQHAQLGREEFQLRLERIEAAVVARDVQQQTGLALGRRGARDEIGER